jgi:hypothetical protein
MTEKASISTRRRPLPGIPLTLLLLAASCVFLASCSNSSSPATPAAATPGALATITITASVTTLTDTDTSETMTATAADSNGVAITGLTFTWTSSNPNIASINGSTSAIVPATPGFATITASAGGISSGGVTLTVTAPLSGQYAFLVQGFGDASGDQVAIIGSFVTDGMGNITSGVEDINGPPGGTGAFPISLPAELTFTGTYSAGTGTESPGLMIFNNSAGFSNEFTFSTGTLSSGVPTVGRMTEWDDSSGSNSQRASGSFYLQNTSAFALSSISGPYAFQFFGQQTAPGSWYVTTGAFTADGSGNLNPGELDVNVPSSGPARHIPSFTGTLATNTPNPTDTTAFGQLVVTFTSGISQTGYLYVVSPTQALFMEADYENVSGLEAGQILAQSTPPFSNASLNGVSVEYEQGLGTTAGRPLAAIGLVTFGSGTANFSRDIDDSGTLDGGTTTPQTELATFPSVASDGRAVIAGSPESAVVYLLSANEGFLMSTTTSATMGFFQPQSGPFSAGSINGNYFGGSPPPSLGQLTPTTRPPVVNDAELASPGNGFATITLDVSFNGGPANSLLRGLPSAFTITVSSNGRAVDTASPANIYYLIGPTSFLMLNPGAAGPAPVPPTPVIDLFQQ